jgi:hypothetical protein
MQQDGGGRKWIFQAGAAAGFFPENPLFSPQLL